VPEPHAPAPREAFQRYTWTQLEGDTPGSWNLSALTTDRAAARARGERFAFRIQPMRGYGTGVADVPKYLSATSTQPDCTAPHPACTWLADGNTYVPNWNHPYVLSRMQALLAEVARTLGGDTSDIAWVDVGLYGQYGEWALSGTQVDYEGATAKSLGMAPASDATKRAIARMHFEAFPSVQQVMFIPRANIDTLRYAFNEQSITALPVGLRWDCLGQDGYMRQWTDRPADWALVKDRWKTAPWVAEFCPFGAGSANPSAATALQQVRDFHVSTVGNANLNSAWADFSPAEQQSLAAIGRESGYRLAASQASVTLPTATTLRLALQVDNLGNAPVYEPWTLQAQVRNASGQVLGAQVLLGAAQVCAITADAPRAHRHHLDTAPCRHAGHLRPAPGLGAQPGAGRATGDALEHGRRGGRWQRAHGDAAQAVSCPARRSALHRHLRAQPLQHGGRHQRLHVAAQRVDLAHEAAGEVRELVAGREEDGFHVGHQVAVHAGELPLVVEVGHAAHAAHHGLGAVGAHEVAHQPVEALHAHLRPRPDHLAHQGHALVQGEHRLLVVAHGHGDDDLVEQLGCALQQVFVAQGDGIEGAGVDGDDVGHGGLLSGCI
jgi:hypothetical protein